MGVEKRSDKNLKPFSVAVTDSHIDALLDAGIVFSNHGKHRINWLTKAKTIIIRNEIFVEANSAFIGAGFFSQGAHSYSKSALDQPVVVGRYCSIGNNVVPMPVGHPMDRVSTSGIDYADFDFYPKTFRRTKPPHKRLTLKVGNDVWIGDGALLGRNITIGHGAVIGARAIVTKDVPPYAIMAGSPATVRRYRFDEATIDRLLASAWWDVEPSCLADLDTTNVSAFLDGFEVLRDQGLLHPYMPHVTALHDLLRLNDI